MEGLKEESNVGEASCGCLPPCTPPWAQEGTFQGSADVGLTLSICSYSGQLSGSESLDVNAEISERCLEPELLHWWPPK